MTPCSLRGVVTAIVCTALSQLQYLIEYASAPKTLRYDPADEARRKIRALPSVQQTCALIN